MADINPFSAVPGLDKGVANILGEGVKNGSITPTSTVTNVIPWLNAAESTLQFAQDVHNVYNKKEVSNNDVLHTTVSGGMAGAAVAGAIAGSVVPGVGTAIGAGIGALVGLGAGLASSSTNQHWTDFSRTNWGYRFASGGQVKNPVQIQVEGGELLQTPDGGFLETRGPRHEKGGVNTIAPEGTMVYSNRVTTDGKYKYNAPNTIANEMKRIINSAKNLQGRMEKNADLLMNTHIKNSYMRKQMANEQKMSALHAYQQDVDRLKKISTLLKELKKVGKAKFASGGIVKDEELNYIPPVQQNTMFDKYTTQDDYLSILMNKTLYDRQNQQLLQQNNIYDLTKTGQKIGINRASYSLENYWNLMYGDKFRKSTQNILKNIPYGNTTLYDFLLNNNTTKSSQNKLSDTTSISGNTNTTSNGKSSSNGLKTGSNDIFDNNGLTKWDKAGIYGIATSQLLYDLKTIAQRLSDKPYKNWYAGATTDAQRNIVQAMGNSPYGYYYSQLAAANNKANKQIVNNARSVNTMRALSDMVTGRYMQNLRGLAAQESAWKTNMLGLLSQYQTQGNTMWAKGQYLTQQYNEVQKDAFYNALLKDLDERVQQIARVGNQGLQNKMLMNLMGQTGYFGVDQNTGQIYLKNMPKNYSTEYIQKATGTTNASQNNAKPE